MLSGVCSDTARVPWHQPSAFTASFTLDYLSEDPVSEYATVGPGLQRRNFGGLSTESRRQGEDTGGGKLGRGWTADSRARGHVQSWVVEKVGDGGYETVTACECVHLSAGLCVHV